MDEAIERVLLGIGSRRHIMTDEERRIVAYHEAGHALVGLSLPGVRVPHKVTIIPRGRSLGYVWHFDEEERAIHSRSTLINQMAMSLGGQAAEEVAFGEAGSGASEDLARVSQTARRMVREYGMSDALGGMTFDDHEEGYRPGSATYSEEELQLIGAEARRIVREARDLSRRVLREAGQSLDELAEALLERETLTAEELEQVVRRSPELAS